MKGGDRLGRCGPLAKRLHAGNPQDRTIATLSDRLWEFSWTSQEGEQRHEEQRQVEQPRVEQQKIEVEQPKVEQRKEEKEQPKAKSVRLRARRRSNSPKRRKRENPRSRKKSRKRERRKKTSHNNSFLTWWLRCGSFNLAVAICHLVATNSWLSEVSPSITHFRLSVTTAIVIAFYLFFLVSLAGISISNGPSICEPCLLTPTRKTVGSLRKTLYR